MPEDTPTREYRRNPRLRKKTPKEVKEEAEKAAENADD
jgi:hypothetical protein|tara:strand:- start:1098 stop:1211 length:114 start_codon:yes stop_codon:yes gene_type:complete